MEDKNLGIIYVLKIGPYSSDVNVRMFMAEWSNSDWRCQGRDSINKLLRECVADYLTTRGNPYEIARYSNGDYLWIKDEYDRMISFLRLTKVRENDNYVNGFRDNPYSTFDVFQGITI